MPEVGRLRRAAHARLLADLAAILAQAVDQRADVDRLALRLLLQAAEELERRAHHGLHLVEVARHLLAQLAVGKHLRAQPHAGDGGPQVVRHRAQDARALQHVAAHPLLHVVEGADHAADLARPDRLERRPGGVFAERIGRAREALQRARDHAHQQRREREADDQQQHELLEQRFQPAERLLGNHRAEHRHRAVLETDLGDDGVGIGKQEIEVPRDPHLEAGGARALAGRAPRARLGGDLDAHRPGRSDLPLQQGLEVFRVAVVLGEPLGHRTTHRLQLHAQMPSGDLLDHLAALLYRQPVEDARRLADARGDLEGGEAIDRAAAVEEVDEHARRLREEQSRRQHEQRAAEKRCRQQPHATRSTAAAST